MQRLKLSHTLRDLIVDGSIFAAFLLTTDPHATGQAIHEWLGVAFGAGIITHLLLHWKWIATVARRFFSKLPAQVRINSLLNMALFVDVVAIVLSGLMMSEVVLDAFGLTGSRDTVWRWLHSTTTNVALIIIGMHVALHWKWVTNALKRYGWQPIAKRLRRQAPMAATMAAAMAVRETGGLQ